MGIAGQAVSDFAAWLASAVSEPSNNRGFFACVHVEMDGLRDAIVVSVTTDGSVTRYHVGEVSK